MKTMVDDVVTGTYKEMLMGFKFRVEFQGIDLKLGFTEVTSLERSVDVVEYREGMDDSIFTKLSSGITKYSNVSLKRGMVVGDDGGKFLSWINRCITRKVCSSDKKDITIQAIDEYSGISKAEWKISNAWPIKYSLSNFNSMNAEILIETLELAYDSYSRKL